MIIGIRTFRPFCGLLGLVALAVVAASVVMVSDAAVVAAEEEKPYRVSEDGVVDWATFSGYRRYHSECHVCHGPDALGSTFAPPLADSMKDLGYDGYLEVVVNGRQNTGAGQEKVMPSFGENLNVMCFIDDIYAYLMARADGAIPRGRPKKEPKPQEAKDHEAECMS